MGEDIKRIEHLIERCNQCKLNACITCDICWSEVQAIENLLTRYKQLEEENKDIREDNYAYHQLLRMQNQREYRSKFLKDFQKEYGKNTMPDYDEIYERYDKQKKQLENSIPKSKIKEKIEELEGELTNEITRNDGFSEYREYAIDVLKDVLEEE